MPHDGSPLTVQQLLDSRLVTQADLAECALTRTDQRTTATVSEAELLEELLRRGRVTAWQLDQLRAGRTSLLLENGRYLLLDELGRGGMGAVYRARHTRMNREVALKVIDPRQGGDPDLVRRFRREVEVCSRLQHEHIVQALDVGQDGELTFLVLEYVAGSDLASLVRRDGKMSPGDVAAIGMQAAAALGYAHAQGIIHRDIKPNNILLSTAGVTKVLDLGLARIVEEETDLARTGLTQAGSVMGTVDYMSPEQARNTHAADARSDIYSLGATLYFLLAGRPVFPGGATIEKLHRLAVETPDALGLLRPDCPRGLTDAIHQMLAKRPEQRFQSAEDVVRALKPFAAERLSGRAVVTSAVQSAAETQRSGTNDEPFLTLATGTVAENLTRQRQRATQPSNLPVWWWGVAAAIAVVVGLAAFLWPARPTAKTTSAPQPARPAAAKSVPVAPQEVRRELPGHHSGVFCSEFSPSGQEVATGGGDGEVRVWNVGTGKVQTIYRGHTASVIWLVWSTDGRRIASRDYFGEVHIFDPLTGSRVGAPIPTSLVDPIHYSGTIRNLEFAPHGQELAILESAQVTLWDLPAGRARHVLPADRPHSLSYSPTGERLAIGGIRGEVAVWNCATAEKLWDHPPDERPKIVQFRRDGQLLTGRSQEVALWDGATGASLQTWTIPEVLSEGGTFDPAIRPFLRIANDGEAALFIAADGPWTIELPSGRQERRPVPTGRGLPESRTDWFRRFSASPNLGLMLDHRTLVCWQTRAGQVVRQFPNVELNSSQFVALEVVHDRFAVAIIVDGRARTRDLLTGEELTLNGAAPAWRDGRLLVPVGHQVCEFTPRGDRWEQGPVVATLAGTTADWHGREIYSPPLEWSADGRFVFTTPWRLKFTQGNLKDRGQSTELFTLPLPPDTVRIWDAQTGERVADLPLGPEAAQLAGFLPTHAANRDLSVFAFGYSDHGRQVIDLLRVWRDRQPAAAQQFPTGADFGPLASVLSDDGQFVAVYGGNGKPLRILRTTDGQFQANVPNHYPNGPNDWQFSPSGERLLWCQEIWDWRREKLLWKCPETDHAHGPTNYFNLRGGAWFSDENHVLIAQDASFQVWNWRTSTKLATLYLLPNHETALVNHVTGHWRGSDNAFQFLKFAPQGTGPRRWQSDYQFAKETGWKNDPEQARFTLPTP